MELHYNKETRKETVKFTKADLENPRIWERLRGHRFTYAHIPCSEEEFKKTELYKKSEYCFNIMDMQITNFVSYEEK
jgi:hypothetical protein